MKIFNFFIILAISLLPVTLYSQENNENEITAENRGSSDEKQVNEIKREKKREPVQTLVNLGEANHSGYAAPFARFTALNAAYGVMAGGRAGWIINDKYVLGIAGCGLTALHKREDITDREDPEDLYFGMGYGGLMLEYYFFPKKLIHISIGALIGAGGYGLYADEENADANMNGNDHGDDGSGESFFVAEPEINLFLNVTRFFRIGIGGTYRYVKGVDRYGMKDDYLRNFSGQVLLAFGWF